MNARRRSIEAELEQVSGHVLTPVRWVVLLGILISLPFIGHLKFYSPAIVVAAVGYAVLAAGLPRLHGRPFTLYAIARLLLMADLLFCAAIFHLSDGVRSPYFGLWYLVLIHAALLLGPNEAVGISVGVAALIIASEWLMPGRNGAGLRTLDFSMGKLPFLPLIAWTAGRLAQEIRDREAARRQVERRALTLEAEEARLRQEMEFARRVQESLLPMNPSPPPGLTLATFAQPAREVGGDTYDLIPLPEGQLLIAVADVSGKGVPAALLVVAVQQGFRQYAEPDPAAVLAGVNRLLLANTPEEMFVTAACVVIDPCTGVAAAAAAGHPPPLSWDGAHQRLQAIPCRGMTLGLVPEWSGTTERWQMAPGDTLLLYTDGVLDAKLDEHERLGEERLAERLGQAAPASAQEWVDRLCQMLHGCQEWPDDVTAVAIRWSPAPAAWERQPLTPGVTSQAGGRA
jgi:serine phosphatase RsbU (regulator of sigma subunit)